MAGSSPRRVVDAAGEPQWDVGPGAAFGPDQAQRARDLAEATAALVDGGETVRCPVGTLAVAVGSVRSDVDGDPFDRAIVPVADGFVYVPVRPGQARVDVLFRGAGLWSFEVDDGLDCALSSSSAVGAVVGTVRGLAEARPLSLEVRGCGGVAPVQANGTFHLAEVPAGRCTLRLAVCGELLLGSWPVRIPEGEVLADVWIDLPIDVPACADAATPTAGFDAAERCRELEVRHFRQVTQLEVLAEGPSGEIFDRLIAELDANRAERLAACELPGPPGFAPDR